MKHIIALEAIGDDVAGLLQGRGGVGEASGVERGGEKAVAGAHLAEQPADRLGAGVGVERVAVAGPGFGVGQALPRAP